MTRFSFPTPPLSALFPPHVRLPSNHHRRPGTCGLSVSAPPVLPAAKRPFSAVGRLLEEAAKTHYEALNLPADASMAEIKKSFYSLSKAHHPDHNPRDPHAPHRFMRISEAYAVLGHADKRAAYDREVMRHYARPGHGHGHGAPAHSPGYRPSYHSTGPAGGRPASGLSRRRGTFRGPPPSFYRNTGTGGAAKAEGNFYSATGAGGAGASAGGAGGAGRTNNRTGHAGFGTGAGPGNVNPDDMGTRQHPATPHFDQASTERTHRRLDERWAQRRAAAEAEGKAFETDSSMLAGFLLICAALAAGVVMPAVLFGELWRKTTQTAQTKSKAT